MLQRNRAEAQFFATEGLGEGGEGGREHRDEFPEGVWDRFSSRERHAGSVAYQRYTRGMIPRAAPRKIRAVQRALARWFLRNQRDLPWRHTSDPYKILVSEVMLQQTQVDRVIPKYRQWLREFPTVRRLAKATPREVLLAWEGMGYNRRALYLHRAAREVLTRYGGRVPTTAEELRTLPGVGVYTAAAVATFSTGQLHPLADTNVRRVTTRLFVGVGREAAMRERDVLALIERTMLRRAVRGIPPSHWGHLLMDFGALVCKARPRCDVCPVQHWCAAYPAVLTVRRSRRRPLHPLPSSLDPRQHLPDRIYRGRVVQLVRSRDPRPVPVRDIGPEVLPGYTSADRPWVVHLLRALVGEGLLSWEGGCRFVVLPRE